MKTRITTSALALLMLGAMALSACGDSAGTQTEGEGTQAATNPVVTEEPTEADLRKAIPDNLPEKDMGGYEFRVWTRERSDFVEDVGFDLEETGEVVDDAIYARNRDVEERFNVDLVQHIIADANASADIVKGITSGEDTHDVAMGQVIAIPKLGTEGYFLDWYEDLPYVNLEAPWYIGNAADALSVAGHAYAMIGEFDLDVLRFTYCMYFNKEIAANYDLENIYDVVNEGRWTHDYLRQLSTEIYTDLNGDGAKSEDDLLCISGDPKSAVVTYQYAYNNPTYTLDKDGIPQLTLDTAKANDIVNKLNDLYWVTPGGYTQGWGTGSTAWWNGNLLFYTGLFQNANGYREVEFDFGIIPYPKYDEAQTQYYTMSDGAHGVMTVPVTLQNTEYASIIIEALNAETYKQVVPAYYDVSLKVKAARDDESVKALDLLMASRVFDFGYIYNTGSLCFTIQDLVSANSNKSESMYASKMKAALKEYEKIVEAYLELE